ncbi:MAG: hypothetical protein JW757_04715 [Anaerolineales bacterium]|nr:hypothetical protein [Anaerolineales bacterium]
MVPSPLSLSSSQTGGVEAVTVERGSAAAVRDAVRLAVETLGPRGFILSPVDNLTIDAPQTWRNIDTFIQAWIGFR